MNYKESLKILGEVKKAKNILVACHRGPDMDSVGSATAMAEVLRQMGKEVEIVCTSEIPETMKFLKGAGKIVDRVNFESFDFSKYDLFLAMDSGSWQMIAYNPKAKLPDMKIIVIDHHKTNEKFGSINLIDSDVTSVGELLYYVFEDWGIEIDKNIANSLLTGILGDTGVFMYPGSGKNTLEIAQKLMSLGADKDDIISRMFRSMDFKLVKFIGEILDRMEIDQKHKFVWSVIPNDIYLKYGRPETGKEVAASMFMQSVSGTEFGIVIVEIEKGVFSMSIRSRRGFDVSHIAIGLGGGGHRAAAGARIIEENFDRAISIILDMARKYAKKYNLEHTEKV